MPKQSLKSEDKRNVTEEIREYVEKRIELATLSLSEQLAQIFADSMQKALGLILLSLALFYAWFGLGFYLGGLIGMVSVGFFIASLPLFILGYILFKRRSQKLTDKIKAELVGKVMENFDSERENNQKNEKEANSEQ